MLKLINITKKFAGYSEPIFANINLQLQQGELCVLLGNNGSGKSTLMSCVAGTLPIDSGNIMIAGQDVTNKDRNLCVSSVSQDINSSTIPQMTVLENIVLSMLRTKSAKLKFYTSYKVQIIAMLNSSNIGLAQYLDFTVQRLSGGQRQMLAIFMATINNPQLLLLDEPTSALSPIAQNMLMKYIKNYVNNNNITTLMITHDLKCALQYCDRLIVLHNKKILLNVAGSHKHKLTQQDLLALLTKDTL